jgi:hypothetical protein
MAVRSCDDVDFSHRKVKNWAVSVPGWDLGVQWGAGRPEYLSEIPMKFMKSVNQELRGFVGGHFDIWHVN